MISFDQTYKANYCIMHRIGMKMIGDEDAICDIIQEIFIALYQKITTGYEIKNTKSWLIRATMNKCIDYNRQVKKQVVIDEMVPCLAADDLSDYQYTEQTLEILHLALSKLKPNEKTLAVLYSESMTYSDMSEITGIKESSIGKTLSRTLEKLSKILKELNYEMY